MNIRNTYTTGHKRPTSKYYITRVVDHHEFIHKVITEFEDSPVNNNKAPVSRPGRQRKRYSRRF